LEIDLIRIDLKMISILI